MKDVFTNMLETFLFIYKSYKMDLIQRAC